MRGAVAAGHPLTAAAGACVLEAGGNAVDACVAAAFVSWVCESPLTGPGGGGFMLVHDAPDGKTRLLDFFVAQPARRSAAPMVEVDVPFEGDTSQVFHVGAPSVAVPGTALGLETAHRRWGTIPWRDLMAPAVELARQGVELTRPQAYLHAILEVLLRREPEGAAMYGAPDGGRLVAGDVFRPLDLAATLERIGEEGAAAIYAGELGAKIADHVQAGGGELTHDDLAAYRVVQRRPLSIPYRGHEFRTNPPPSSGGVLVALGLQEMDGDVSADAVARAMHTQNAARGPDFVRGLYRGGLSKRLLSGTTHISVVDERGDAASLSSSLGSGSGVVVPGTGIHLNNMLGEWDLAADVPSGARLTSMMAPSLVLKEGRPRLVLGSAGSARLRGAILQVVLNVIGRGLGVEEAVDAPRIHVEDGVLHCEGGAEEAQLVALEAAGWQLVRWKRRNLFFGGVSAVEVRDDGTLAAAGDPRRGGAGVVVT
jgi:gamma-glutamyltranspeptidase/glutathione hydrolase